MMARARIRLLASLRARVTASAVAAVTVAFVVAGAVLIGAIDRDARAGVDRDLERRVSSVLGPQGGRSLRVASEATVKLPPAAAAKLAQVPPDQRGQAKAKLAAGNPGTPGVGLKPLAKQNLLLGSGIFARVISKGMLVKQVGDIAGAQLPTSTGFQTISVHGRLLRTLTVEQNGATLEVGEPLAPALDRATSTRRIVIFAGLIGLAATGWVVWLLAGLALRPVRRLRRRAEQVSTTRDLDIRLPDNRGPAEVDALAHTLNAMLTRLAASSRETEQALVATRRFAADTGHEIRTPLTSAQANLDVLRRNPEMPVAERTRIIEEIAAEQRRLVSLLDSLQALARGDAAGHCPQEEFDLAEMLDAAVQAARRRHPLVRLSLTECPDAVELDGWPDGARNMIDNLLQNAALHAGSRALVEVALRRRGQQVVLTVDDDGPGVPMAERHFERFVRGETASAPGSGLGLAIVAQQASLHRGRDQSRRLVARRRQV
jgi:signal transduction histidine kinase